jgi:hypothetical protein
VDLPVTSEDVGSPQDSSTKSLVKTKMANADLEECSFLFLTIITMFIGNPKANVA